MNRQSFLTFSSVVALAVAVLALCFPSSLLTGKGVVPTPALLVWVREVGALILAAGVTSLLVRKAPDSVAMLGVLVGNAVLHVALLPIEVVAFGQGVIRCLAGVIPNSLVHVVLASGYIIYAWKMHRADQRSAATHG
jgi:hypothetical protein